MSEFLESVLVFGLRVFLVCVDVEQVSEFLLSEFLSAFMGLHFKEVASRTIYLGQASKCFSSKL